MKAGKYDRVLKAVDKIIRDETIRKEHKLIIAYEKALAEKNNLPVDLGKLSANAIKTLAKRPYQNIDGREYFIGEKMIQEIIYQPKRRTEK